MKRRGDAARDAATETLSVVAQQLQSFTRGGHFDFSIVSRLTEQIHRQDDVRRKLAVFLHHDDGRFRARRIYVENVSSTSTNTGETATSATTSAEAAKVKIGTNTASPGPTFQARSTIMSASVPSGVGDNVLDAGEFGQIVFQLFHLQTHDPLAGVDGIQWPARASHRALTLDLQVNELELTW